MRKVSVMGDYCPCDHAVGMCAVTSTDGTTADFYPFDMKFIGCGATSIVSEVRHQPCVDISSKPLGTIEWE